MPRRSMFEIWQNTFKPIPNPKGDGQLNGCLFNFCGSDLDVVSKALESEPNKVWTVVEGDNGKWYVSQGYHYVNRVGYLITEVPFDPLDAIQAKRYSAKDVFYM